MASLIVSKRKLIDTIVAGDLDGDTDFMKVRQYLRWLHLPDPVAELDQLWNATYALVSSEWPGIVRIARVLRERGYMGGDAFETVWRAVRPTPAWRRRLEARHGDGFAGWRQRFLDHGSEFIMP